MVFSIFNDRMLCNGRNRRNGFSADLAKEKRIHEMIPMFRKFISKEETKKCFPDKDDQNGRKESFGFYGVPIIDELFDGQGNLIEVHSEKTQCAHSGDLVPSLEIVRKRYRTGPASQFFEETKKMFPDNRMLNPTYKSIAYVIEETKSLAEQAKGAIEQ